MPKNTKDKMYIRASEWSSQYGGVSASKRYHTGTGSSNGGPARTLPFDCCALTLGRYVNPVISTIDNVIFESSAIIPYLKSHPFSPLTGNQMSYKDLIPLNIPNTGCPVLCKPFTDTMKICYIRPPNVNSVQAKNAIKSGIDLTPTVYSYEAVYELNVKAKNWFDLITGLPFSCDDVVILQDPSDESVCKRRDVSGFEFLKKELLTSNGDSGGERHSKSGVRMSVSQQRVMDEINANNKAAAIVKQKEEEAKALLPMVDTEQTSILLNPTVQVLTSDLLSTANQTSGLTSQSLTSTSIASHTSNKTRYATELDLLKEIAYLLKASKKKKAYVKLETSHGDVLLELHADITPYTVINFVTLVRRGFYDNTPFHRLIPNFMIQGGAGPTGKEGGESAFLNGMPFQDEIDLERLFHQGRGVLSMANSGADSNKSQFFITFASCRHLDGKHSVFGKVVGGIEVFDAIERVGSKGGGDDRPKTKVMIKKGVVVDDLVRKAEERIHARVAERFAKEERERARVEGLKRKVREAEEERVRIANVGGIEAGEEGRSVAKVGLYIKAAGDVTHDDKKKVEKQNEKQSKKKAPEIVSEENEEEFPLPIIKKKAKQSGGFGNFSGW